MRSSTAPAISTFIFLSMFFAPSFYARARFADWLPSDSLESIFGESRCLGFSGSIKHFSYECPGFQQNSHLIEEPPVCGPLLAFRNTNARDFAVLSISESFPESLEKSFCSSVKENLTSPLFSFPTVAAISMSWRGNTHELFPIVLINESNRNIIPNQL